MVRLLRPVWSGGSWWAPAWSDPNYEGDRLGCERCDAREVAGLDALTRDHPRTAHGGDRRDAQVLVQVLRTDPTSGHEGHAVERRRERGDRSGTTRGSRGEELHLSLIHISEPTRLGMISYA